jgi:hypothetical protein
MKNEKVASLFAVLFLCAAAVPVLAADAGKDEQKLETSAAEVEKIALLPDGQQRVEERLKARYGVDDARLQGLREQKMGYGEISIALGLAAGLPGGINDANVAKITALRQGPPAMGWGRIAKDLGLKLGPAVKSAQKVSSELRKQERERKEAGLKYNKGERGGKPERNERPQRPENQGKGNR